MTSRALILAGTGARPFPPPPTRDRICGVHLTFQGLTVNTVQYGVVRWFEPWLQNLTAADRQAVYAAKRARPIPDTHVIFHYATRLGGWYGQPNPQFSQFPSVIGEPTPTLFLALVEEVIREGFVPIIAYDGDNGDNPVDGYPNALRQLPILGNLLKSSQYGDLNQYVLLVRFWDGVFYGSSPENIQAFGTSFREFYGNDVCLGIQHNDGHIPVGNGPADWEPGGMMDAYDVLFSEYMDSSEPDRGNQTIWQVNGRCVRPYYRPADQVGDPAPPFYLVPSSRGFPRYHCAFEGGYVWGEYGWVRGYSTAAQIETWRQYQRAMGCQYTG